MGDACGSAAALIQTSVCAKLAASVVSIRLRPNSEISILGTGSTIMTPSVVHPQERRLAHNDDNVELQLERAAVR